MNKQICTWLIAAFFLSCGTQHETGRLPLDEPVPAFSAGTPDGKTVSLADYSGKIVLIHFWADWCADCRAEFAKLEASYRALKDQNFEILAINVGQSPAHVNDFIQKYDLTFPMLLDEQKEIADLYMIRGLPTNYFIRPDQRLGKVTIGWVNKEQIARQISKMREDAK